MEGWMRLLFVILALSMFTSCSSTHTAPVVGEIGDVRAPVVVTKVEPEYPVEMRNARVEGVVEISGTVPKEGGVLRNPRVVRSDDARLEPLALEAVSRWVFKPGTGEGGEPADVEFRTTIRFLVD
jgi:protein TonB